MCTLLLQRWEYNNVNVKCVCFFVTVFNKMAYFHLNLLCQDAASLLEFLKQRHLQQRFAPRSIQPPRATGFAPRNVQSVEASGRRGTGKSTYCTFCFQGPFKDSFAAAEYYLSLDFNVKVSF